MQYIPQITLTHLAVLYPAEMGYEAIGEIVAKNWFFLGINSLYDH
jgi:hypothetical protein